MRLCTLLKKPRRDDYNVKFSDYMKFRSGICPAVTDSDKFVEALNSNTLAMMQQTGELRYQSAVADWKGNVAIVLNTVALVLTMTISIITGCVAHRDSNATTDMLKHVLTDGSISIPVNSEE